MRYAAALLQRYKKLCLLICSGLLISIAMPAYGRVETEGVARKTAVTITGSPEEVGQQLANIRVKKASIFETGPLELIAGPWQRLTKALQKKYHLTLGVAYTALYQRASFGSPNKDASSGDFDFFGNVLFYHSERVENYLGFKVEQRHRIGPITPSALHQNIDAVIKTTSGFNKLPVALDQFWWEQDFVHAVAGYRIGKIDVTDLMDVYAFEGQNFFFLNEAFTEQLSVAFPDNGLGVIGGAKFTKKFYIKAAVADANGTKTNSGRTLFDETELFQAIEVGLSVKPIEEHADNIHIMIWKSNRRKKERIPSGYGVTFSAQQNLNERYIYFVRLGTNDGTTAAELKSLVALGVGIDRPFKKKFAYFGVAVANGKPSHKHEKDEQVIETFCRLQLTAHAQFTPDLQLIHNQPGEDGQPRRWVWVAGLRFRTAF